MVILVLLSVLMILLGLVSSHLSPDRSIAFVSLRVALPVPVVLFVLFAPIFLGTLLATPEQCGVDACGMTAALTLIGMLFAGILPLLGWPLALLGAIVERRWLGDQGDRL